MYWSSTANDLVNKDEKSAIWKGTMTKTGSCGCVTPSSVVDTCNRVETKPEFILRPDAPITSSNTLCETIFERTYESVTLKQYLNRPYTFDDGYVVVQPDGADSYTQCLKQDEKNRLKLVNASTTERATKCTKFSSSSSTTRGSSSTQSMQSTQGSSSTQGTSRTTQSQGSSARPRS